MNLITRLLSIGRNLLLIAFFLSTIAFSNSFALADTTQSHDIDIIKQAANEVAKDTGAKEQFGKSKNGNELLDKAQNKANRKLNDLADEAANSNELSTSKKLFLDNLTNNN